MKKEGMTIEINCRENATESDETVYTVSEQTISFVVACLRMFIRNISCIILYCHIYFIHVVLFYCI